MPTEFEHITVPSRDLEASISFYSSLGMKLIEHEPLHHAHFENTEHGVIFTSYYNEQPPSCQVNVYLEVHDLKLYEIRFREQILSREHHTSWNGSTLRLSDPDGNFVTLYKLLSQDARPPWNMAP